MYNYEDMLQAFQQKRIMKRILSHLTDEDIMNLNYISKGINMAIRKLKHYEFIPSEELNITLHIEGNVYTYKAKPQKFDPSQVTKITFNFLVFGTPVQYENLDDIYFSMLNKICTDVNKLFLLCNNNLHIQFQAYYPFFKKFLISFFNSLNCSNRVQLDFDFKPYAEDFDSDYSDFNYPSSNMLKGFLNVETVTIRSNFNKGTEFFKYLFRCLPDSEFLKVNINFIEYLNQKQWRNVESIIKTLKSTKFKMGLNCWGEDGSFWNYIPSIFTTDLLKRVYRFEINGDSFNILREFKSFFKKTENLKTLVCNFHVYEYAIKSFNSLSKHNFEMIDICEELKNLSNLTSVICTFNYIYDFNQNNAENLKTIDYTFDKLLESLPLSVTKLSITGIRVLDVKLANKMHAILPNLIYLNISKINCLSEDFLVNLPNVRFIISHACQPIIIPPTITVCGTICCLNLEVIDCVKFFKTYWRYCHCQQNHKAWRKSIGKLKRYRKTLERSTNYNINLFYSEIKDGWNVLKVFSQEYLNNMYKDTYYRRSIL